MKRLMILFGMTAVCVAWLSSQTGMIRVKNPSKTPRAGAIAEVRWAEVARIHPSLDPQSFRVVDLVSREPIPAQTIDENGDGAVDLLLLRVDLKSGEERRYSVAAERSTPVDALTDARFVLPREDFAWENDRIAFRMYGPALAKDVNNGVDVWTKRVRYLIVEKWYKASEGSAPGKDSYHVDSGEGADFFAVGRTLGAGGSALLAGDSLVQPGVFASQRVIAAGPLRAIFELTYKPVSVHGRSLTETRRVTLDAGSNLNKMDVTYRGEGNAVLRYAAGIVKRNGTTTSTNSREHWAALWGPTNDKEENGSLGTGVVMPKESFIAVREDSTHVLLIGKARVGASVTYYSGAGWSRSGDFPTQTSWNEYLSRTAQTLSQPLRVRVGAK